MNKIDLNTWSRREQWNNFSKLGFPFYHVSFYLDVTPVRDWAKLHALSFYHSMCWLVTASMNDVENFRYRIRGDEVWLIDKCHPCLTVMRPGSTDFQNLTCKMQPNIGAFCRRASSLLEQEWAAPRHEGDFVVGDTDIPLDQCCYLSCLPWINSTEICSERGLDPDDSIPRVAWGKYINKFRTDRRESLRLNITVDVNHRLIDGYHIGAFARRLEERIAAL
ncbi:MAG: hypothetical protein LUC24_05120 [Bacteroidales bacterium]|nr:hypothetical protein [Bacteroidales bacterium]